MGLAVMKMFILNLLLWLYVYRLFLAVTLIHVS